MTKLYSDLGNIHALKACVLSKRSGFELEFCVVDLATKKRKESVFACLPFFTVPVLQDGDVVVSQPNAIAQYLLAKATKHVSAAVDVVEYQHLEWEESTFQRDSRAFFASLAGVLDFTAKEISDSRDKTTAHLTYLNGLLLKSPYLSRSGDVGIADITIWCAVYPALAEHGLLPAEDDAFALEALRKWFSNIHTLSYVQEGLALAGIGDVSTACKSVVTNVIEFHLSKTIRKYPLSERPRKQPVMVTTPIYYVNGEPHIGHVYTTLLADTYARWCRLRDIDVFFMTGTDEHGEKVAESAHKKGKTPKEFADEVSGIFRKTFEDLNMRWEYFIRTTDKNHKESVLHLWDVLFKKGFIYKGFHEGWYCVTEEAFYTETEVVEGNDASDGKPGPMVTKDTQRRVKWHKEENFMFKLSEMERPLLDFYRENPNFVAPRFRQSEIEKFVRGGLRDLSVSRTKISWGIPIPQDSEHVMYVWLDALTNYLTGAGYPKDGGKPRWPADTHVVGKDILRFHAVYWPAFLLAAELPCPKRILAHGWWTKDKMKIGKSLGNAFDPRDVAAEYGLDPLRFFLLRESSLGTDGDYSDNAMEKRLNTDLANALGNLMTRAIAPALNSEGVVPSHGEFSEDDEQLIKELNDLPGTVDHYFQNFDFQRGLIAIWGVISQANKYMNAQAPWVLKKDPKQKSKLDTVLYMLIDAVRLFALLLSPVMPQVGEKALDQLGVPADERCGDDVLRFGVSKPGAKLGDDKSVLFKKHGEMHIQKSKIGRGKKKV